MHQASPTKSVVAFALLMKATNACQHGLTGADLTGADLTGANLTCSNGYGVVDSDLGSCSTFESFAVAGSNLTNANLTNANLTGATLKRVNLTGANLTGANLTGADLTGATCPNGKVHGANGANC
jgi:uncharacterized protein YjbI with pentapeptide repeats